MAERVMAELTRRGAGRQTAYARVRSCSIEANQKGEKLEEIIASDSEIRKYLSLDDIKEIMDPNTYLGSAVDIVENVLVESQSWFE